MLEFLQMAPPPKWPFLYVQYDPRPLCSANTSSRNTDRARALLAAVVLRRPDPQNRHKATTIPRRGRPQNIVALLLNRLAVLFKLFRYWHQLRNFRHFFAPQLQGSLLLASSIGNL